MPFTSRLTGTSATILVLPELNHTALDTIRIPIDLAVLLRLGQAWQLTSPCFLADQDHITEIVRTSTAPTTASLAVTVMYRQRYLHAPQFRNLRYPLPQLGYM